MKGQQFVARGSIANVPAFNIKINYDANTATWVDINDFTWESKFKGMFSTESKELPGDTHLVLNSGNFGPISTPMYQALMLCDSDPELDCALGSVFAVNVPDPLMTALVSTNAVDSFVFKEGWLGCGRLFINLLNHYFQVDLFDPRHAVEIVVNRLKPDSVSTKVEFDDQNDPPKEIWGVPISGLKCHKDAQTLSTHYSWQYDGLNWEAAIDNMSTPYTPTTYLRVSQTHRVGPIPFMVYRGLIDSMSRSTPEDRAAEVYNDLMPIMSIGVPENLYLSLREAMKHTPQHQSGLVVVDNAAIGRRIVELMCWLGLLDDEHSLLIDNYDSFVFANRDVKEEDIVDVSEDSDEDDLPEDVESFIDNWIFANMCDGEDRRGTKDKHHMKPDDLHEFGHDLARDLLLFLKEKDDEQ